MDRNEYLRAMGIQQWQRRNTIPQNQQQKDFIVEANRSIANDDWQSLKQEAENCIACDLSKTRTQVVFGVGNQHADLLIVGEAPGANEDKQGEPFVGRAGQLLNNMLYAISLQREDIYIANILKCRPPNNRDPRPEEVALCTPFLERQITLLQPKIILALGRIAAHFLLGSIESLGKMRGREFSYRNTPLIVFLSSCVLATLATRKAKIVSRFITIKKISLAVA